MSAGHGLQPDSRVFWTTEFEPRILIESCDAVVTGTTRPDAFTAEDTGT